MSSLPDPRSELERTGFRAGQKISRNLGKPFLALGAGIVGIFGVALLAPTRDDLGPRLLFLALVVLGVSLVVRWHWRRPEVVFREDGLSIEGKLFAWSQVKRIRVGATLLRIQTETDAGGTQERIAVRADAIG